ncbi:MAG: DUF3048 domain-containing protein [Anaerolineae bacterium]|nr:MAG: DUF3048 domain-containing protein [Anaerolineae bacterium]
MVLLILILLLIISGCAKEEETITLTFTPDVPEVESEPLLVSLDMPATDTAARDTPAPFVLAPTFTPLPTLTPIPTATAAAATPVVLLNKEDFGTDRNPLTGELLDDSTNLDRRPIAVKISNAPAKWVRPQSGLGQADIVFEHVTEGLITRFTAIIYGQTPEKLGPIRSARLIDLQIPLMYDSALAYSGSSIGVSRKLFASKFRSSILRTNVSGYYRTGEAKPYEHTLYAIPEELWEVLERRELNRKPELSDLLTFTTEPPANGEQAGTVKINYRDWTIIEWRYNKGSYFRWADGDRHIDANTGKQISASNVIVIFADHSLDRSICEYQSGGTCLAYSTEIDLLGSGEAILFRNGYQYDIEWRRSKDHDMLTFYDSLGNPMPLNIGNSWFQIIPNIYPDPVSISP